MLSQIVTWLSTCVLWQKNMPKYALRCSKWQLWAKCTSSYTMKPYMDGNCASSKPCALGTTQQRHMFTSSSVCATFTSERCKRWSTTTQDSEWGSSKKINLKFARSMQVFAASMRKLIDRSWTKNSRMISTYLTDFTKTFWKTVGTVSPLSKSLLMEQWSHVFQRTAVDFWNASQFTFWIERPKFCVMSTKKSKARWTLCKNWAWVQNGKCHTLLRGERMTA